MKKIKFLALIAGILTFVGCQDLDVENENNPDRARAIASPSDLLSILSGGFSNAHTANYSGAVSSVYENPKITLAAMADELTTTNAFQRIWDFTNEPRLAIDNTLTYSGIQRIQNPWQQHNFAINAANQMIRAIEDDGFVITNTTGTDITQMSLASAYFLRGYSKGYLGLMYDRAFIADADGFDAAAPTFSPYADVVESGVSDLDQAISISNANTFTTDEWWPGVGLSNAGLAQWASTMAAKFLISKGRTAAEYDNALWTRIRDYALNGLTSDIVVSSNNNTVGFVDFTIYVNGVIDWFLRVDYRIMSKISNDPAFPLKHPADNTGALPETTSDDNRYAERIRYTTSTTGLNPARGVELFSFYNGGLWSESVDLGADLVGDYAPYTAIENNLILAEAYINLGNLASAFPLINNTRVGNGGLTALDGTETATVMEDALEYELDVELYLRGIGVSYFRLRRTDQLQVGTPLHFPIPATELSVLGEDLYTFGGSNTEGTASGSNSWF